MNPLPAALLLAMAQVKVTTPPSQPTPPSPQEKAMEEIHLQAQANEGDQHYLKRAEGRNGDIASPVEITAALEAYAAAMAKNREDVDSRWKYLRATYYKAEYTGLDDAKKAALYDRAKPVAEEAIAALRRKAALKAGRASQTLEPQELGAALAGDTQAGETFFWTAVNWGQWGLAHGKWASARAGAASKIRDDCRITIAVDPKLEDAGGYRVLGRLHSVSPRIPLVTGWIDRQEAVEDLRKAVSLAPRNLINLFFLAEALHEWTDQREEAVEILRQVIAATPHPDHLVEDLRIQADARRDLDKWAAR
jgi:tetratricopeptide (TPR) repeat protein